MLSGEGKGSTDDEAEETKLSTLSRRPLHHRTESLDCRGGLDLPELLQVPGVHPPVAMLPLEYQDCNGKMLKVPSELYLHLDSRKEDPFDYDENMEDVSPKQPLNSSSPPPSEARGQLFLEARGLQPLPPSNNVLSGHG